MLRVKKKNYLFVGAVTRMVVKFWEGGKVLVTGYQHPSHFSFLPYHFKSQLEDINIGVSKISRVSKFEEEQTSLHELLRALPVKKRWTCWMVFQILLRGGRHGPKSHLNAKQTT